MSNNIVIDDNDTWPVLEAFFQEYGFVNHQKESYNDFIDDIPNTIGKNDLVTDDGYRVSFENVVFENPCHKEISEEVRRIHPKQCIDRNISYLSHIFTDITMETPYKKIKKYKNVHIGSIPVMVKSRLCNLYEIQNDEEALADLEEDIYDNGGYFIINGSPKIIASQQKVAYNKIYIFSNRKDRPCYNHYAEVRSSANSHSTTTYIGIKDGIITAVIPYIENVAIPIGVLFHALGAKSYDDIINCITPNREDVNALRIIEASLEQSCTIKDQEESMCYIGKRGKKFIGKSIDSDGAELDSGAVSYAKHLLTNELFPHTGTDFEKKMYYAGLMIRNLLDVHFGRREIEDRDHYANKRIATVGVLFKSLFYTAFRKLRSEISNSLGRCVKGSTAVNIISLIKSAMIRSTMCNALTSNVWGGRGKQQGISQTFDRFNYTAGLANARRFITPMSAEGGKVEGPRHLHNSHWGVVCPAETPEGKKCLIFGTKIATPFGMKTIESLVDGDIVYSVDPMTLLSTPTMITNHFTIRKRVYKIIGTGFSITATADHPFLIKTARGGTDWKELSEIKKGERLVMKYVSPVERRSNEAIWARIIGYGHDNSKIILDDACYEWVTKFHCFEDVKEFVSDLRILGFPYDIHEYSGHRIEGFVNGRSVEEYSFKFKCGSLFAKKITDLGYSSDNFTIPSWILNGDIGLKKEYVAGFQTVYLDIFQKRENTLYFICKEKTDVELYAKWFESVYTELGVIMKYEITKVGLGWRCTLSFSIVISSCIALCENLGYRYDRSRYDETALLWFYSRHCDAISATKNFVYPTMEEYGKDHYISNGSCMVDVIAVESAGVRKVADFTTLSKNHSFIADGFVTHNCGLVTNASMQCLVTIGSETDEIEEMIRTMNIIGFEEITESKGSLLSLTKIFINGDFIAVTKHPDSIVNELRSLRRSSGINPEISIYLDKKSKEIHVSSDAGRLCRPLLIIEKGKLVLGKREIDEIVSGKWQDKPGNTWSTLLSDGYVELIDKLEEEGTMIATFPSDLADLSMMDAMGYTHCELHPSMIFGVGASLIPHSNTNQSPRNTYQCLWEEEPILMGDGTKMMIKDVKIGDSVITFNPETFEKETTKVVFHHVSETDKKIVKVTTVSGREIVVTEDHKMMTDKGWVEAGKLTDERVAISLDQIRESVKSEESIILTEETFREKLEHYNVRDRLIRTHEQHLKTLELLPLREDNPNLHLLARIYGFVLTDGSLGVYRNSPRIQGDFGSRESADSFEKDMSALGYNKTKVVYNVANYKGSVMKTYTVQHSNSLSSLLIALGFSPGKKVTQLYPRIPDWINKNKYTARNFLAAFQGGDGCQIRWNSMDRRGFNFVCGDTLKTSRDAYIQSLRDMMEDIKTMFGLFDIETKVVEYGSGYEGSRQCGVRIACTGDNLVRYYDEIGYIYCNLKKIKSGKVVEYLKYKRELKNDHVRYVTDIRELLKEKTVSDVAKLTGNTYAKVSAIQSSMDKGRVVSMRRLKQSEKPDAWTIDNKKDIIFVPVKSVIAHKNVRISDITTESGFHSFIGGDGFCVHNSSMAKQAVGVPGTNYLHQTKGKFHALNYPQKPLVTTKLAKIIGFDKLPAGQNAVVMVCPWYGYGQEDSIIMNQDSIDRGFMNVTTFIGFDGRARKDRFEKFEVPCRESCSNYKGNNSKLDPVTGIVSEGQIVNTGDILIGITSLANQKSSIHQHQKISISVLYEEPISGRVHKIQFGEDGDGYEYVRIVIAQLRIPEYGDKFAAFPGQKGTVGMTFRSYDLPFTKEGIAPDILLNPLALPSRMTIGLLIEIIQGRKIASSSFLNHTPTNKVFRLDDETYDNPIENSSMETCVYESTKLNGDGTPFNKDFSLRKICDELKRLGINEFSDEVVINGRTGEQMECLVFTGICFYQRLKHMVVEKVHARSRGGRTRLTRQPREGRRIGGGFRVGVMEKDALLGNGAPYFTKDRLMEQSDEYRMWFCEICGLQAIVVKGDPELGIMAERSCRLCENNKLFKVRIPYATKLLMQEFAGMNVMIRVLSSKYKEKVKIMAGHKLVCEGVIE